jgi:cytidyltransferase-like protein
MDTFGQNFEIRSIPLSIKSYKNKVEKFLNDNDLRLDGVDYYAGVFLIGEDDILLGGGGLLGNVIKCIAITDDLRETGMGTKLISHLYLQAINNGEDSVRVFTKPENKEIFTSLGFKLLSTSDKAILLENGNGLKHYCDYLASLRREGENGAIVMNANPFTLGHRYLIETAAKEVNNLYIIVVKENRSLFSYDDRKRMITKGT